MKNILLRAVAVAVLCLVGFPSGTLAQDNDQSSSTDATSDEFPVPVRDPAPGSSDYTATINMNGQEMTMNVTRTVEESDAGWRVTETAAGPMGEVSDTEILAKGTLTPIERHTVQGPVEINLNYSAETVEGSFSMNGQERPVNVDLDQAIYSDGAGSSVVVSSLPLEEGYDVRYGTFDLMSQQVRPMRLSVTGIEEVTVPAGTFEAFRVEVGPDGGDPGGSTLWVTTDTFEVAKVETRLPQMNGAIVTSVLQPDSADGESE